jgi:hypothetical protein
VNAWAGRQAVQGATPSFRMPSLPSLLLSTKLKAVVPPLHPAREQFTIACLIVLIQISHCPLLASEGCGSPRLSAQRHSRIARVNIQALLSQLKMGWLWKERSDATNH